MFRNTILFAALFLLFSSCGNNSATPDPTPDPAPDTKPMTAVPAPAATTEMPDKGYKINVVDGTIKSPRKELVGKAGEIPVVINYGSPAARRRSFCRQ
ncbi:MAG: hypothetical protein AAF840_18040, partial [Bacteroidota bacterium]